MTMKEKLLFFLFVLAVAVCLPIVWLPSFVHWLRSLRKVRRRGATYVVWMTSIRPPVRYLRRSPMHDWKESGF